MVYPYKWLPISLQGREVRRSETNVLLLIYTTDRVDVGVVGNWKDGSMQVCSGYQHHRCQALQPLSKEGKPSASTVTTRANLSHLVWVACSGLYTCLFVCSVTDIVTCEPTG